MERDRTLDVQASCVSLIIFERCLVIDCLSACRCLESGVSECRLSSSLLLALDTAGSWFSKADLRSLDSHQLEESGHLTLN